MTLNLYTIKVGDYLRSTKTKVLMEIIKFEVGHDFFEMRIAETGYYMDGKISELSEFFEKSDTRKINRSEWKRYLLTYKADIAEQQQLEKNLRKNNVKQN